MILVQFRSSSFLSVLQVTVFQEVSTPNCVHPVSFILVIWKVHWVMQILLSTKQEHRCWEYIAILSAPCVLFLRKLQKECCLHCRTFTLHCVLNHESILPPPPILLLSLFCRCFVLVYMWCTTMKSRMRWSLLYLAYCKTKSLLKIWGLRIVGDVE